MSTRGTYNVNGRYFYIHHDNYPSGAAEKFKTFLKAYVPGDDIATCFRVAVPRVEYTFSHETHDDTEYRYDVLNTTEVIAYEGVWNKDRTPNSGEPYYNFTCFYNGSIEGFIKEYEKKPTTE